MTELLSAAEAALERLVRGEPWLGVLAAARGCGAPDCWVGGGVLRDLVWDQLHGEFDPARVKDVDVAFYDPGDLTRRRTRRSRWPCAGWRPRCHGRQEPSLGAPLV